MTPLFATASTYLSACMIAATALTFFKTNSLLWPSHLIIIASLAVIAVQALRNKSAKELIPLDAGAVCLYLFAAYYIFKLSIEDSHEVRAGFARYFTHSIAVGVLVGAFAFFSAGERIGLVGRRVWIVLALCVSCATLILVSLFYMAHLRSDIFLVRIPGGHRSYYQMFGDYLAMLFVCVMASLYFLRGGRGHVGEAVWFSAAVASLTFLAIFLAQAAGSNKATLLVALIGAGVMGRELLLMISVQPPRWLVKSGLTVCVGLVAVAGAWEVAAHQPPMRIVGFREIPPLRLPDFAFSARQGPYTEPREPEGKEATTRPRPPILDIPSFELEDVGGASIEGRKKIWQDYAWAQFTHSPVFGDLSADRDVTGERGYYLHSLASVQVHFGVVGTLLLGGYLISRLRALYRRSGSAILQVAAPAILLAAFLTSFFSWMPFWFLVGALFPTRVDDA